MPLLSRYFGFVREISFLSGRMKFRFAFDMFVFRNKKFDRSFALVSSIHPENSRERKEQRFSGFSSSFSFFSLCVLVETRVRKLFCGSLKNLFIV